MLGIHLLLYRKYQQLDQYLELSSPTFAPYWTQKIATQHVPYQAQEGGKEREKNLNSCFHVSAMRAPGGGVSLFTFELYIFLFPPSSSSSSSSSLGFTDNRGFAVQGRKWQGKWDEETKEEEKRVPEKKKKTTMRLSRKIKIKKNCERERDVCAKKKKKKSRLMRVMF